MASCADRATRATGGTVPLPVATLLITVVLVLAGCGSGAARATGGAPSTPAEAYGQRCSGCHGVLGSDQAARSLPNLETMARADIESIVLSGAVGMPAFAEFVERSEIDAIVDYVDRER